MTVHADEFATDLEISRAETVAAYQNRAIVLAYLFEELESELGAERAAEIMKRAIYRRGLEVGERYADAVARGDLAEVGRLFVEGSPAGGALFEPAIAEPAQDGRTVLSMTACPLVDAWRSAGYSAERVDTLCEIASAVDEGTFERAGLDIRFIDRQSCPNHGICLIELKTREKE